jgi:hypothetical protein
MADDNDLVREGAHLHLSESSVEKHVNAIFTNAMTLTHETLARPTPLAQAVRAVDRWGLLAGVTGFLGNVLLLVLITTPADGHYAWTGPANDIVSSVATLALIPVAVGLLAVCGNSRGLGAAAGRPTGPRGWQRGSSRT